jgi:ABC-type multidrug transport system ATPase subunit
MDFPSVSKQFTCVVRKNYWLCKRNFAFTALVVLLPLLGLLRTLFFSTQPATNTQPHDNSTSVLVQSLCTDGHCPKIFYALETKLDQERSIIESALSRITAQKELGIVKYQELPSHQDLDHAIHLQRNLTVIDPSLKSDFYVHFGVNKHSDLIFRTPDLSPFNPVQTNSKWQHFVTSLRVAILEAQLNRDTETPMSERIQVKEQEDHGKKIVQRVLNAFSLWWTVLFSFFPLFGLISWRMANERSQGVNSLLRQWGVSLSINTCANFLSYLFLSVIASIPVVVVMAIIKSDNDIPTMAFKNSVVAMFLISTLISSRGLLSGSLFSGTFGICFMMIVMVLEMICSVLVLVLCKSSFPIFVFFFPFMGLGSFLMPFPEIQIATPWEILFLSVVAQVAISTLITHLRLVGFRSFESFGSASLDKEKMHEVSVSNLTKNYSQKAVVSDVTMSFSKGNVYTLLGHNGAGKSTLMKMMAGLVKPSFGRMSMFGIDVGKNGHYVSSIVAYCAQENQHWEDLTLGEHVKFFSSLVGAEDNNVREQLEEVGLEDSENVRARDLSGGMQRRLNLVLCGIRKRKLILLDEPTSGVDHLTQKRIWRFIEKLKRDSVVILSTHLIQEAHLLSDHTMFMQNGKITTHGSPRFLQESYGRVCQLKLTVNPEQEDVLQSYVQECVPSAEVVSQAPGVITVILMYEELDLIPNLITKAESTLSQFTWQVTNNTVERMFRDNSRTYISTTRTFQDSQTPGKDISKSQHETLTDKFWIHVYVTYWKNVRLFISHWKISLLLFGLFCLHLFSIRNDSEILAQFAKDFSSESFKSDSVSGFYVKTVAIFSENAVVDEDLVAKADLTETFSDETDPSKFLFKLTSLLRNY